VKLRYITSNVAKNLAAPVLLPLMRGRGSYGMDGDPAAVVATLTDLVLGLAPASARIQGATVLELGPGRTPEICMGLVLAGADRAVGLDVASQIRDYWRDPARWRALRSTLEGQVPLHAVRNHPLDDVAAEALAERVSFGVYDGHRVPLPEASVDIVLSKSTLEHVRRRDVRPLLRDLARVVKPGGVMVHVIDLRDHMWINGDDVAGDWLDGLRYPEPLFRAMFSNRSTMINRLRSADWRRAFRDAGFEVRAWDERRYPLPEGFRAEALSRPFRHLTEAELGIGYVRGTLVKRDSSV
jgi:SAM-dependent methyltransferase